MFLINGRLLILLGIILYVIGRGILLGIRYNQKIQIDFLRGIVLFLFVSYIYMVVSVTIFPIPIGFTSNLEDGYRSINLILLNQLFLIVVK